MQLALVLPDLRTLRTDQAALVRAPALAHLLTAAGTPMRDRDGIAAVLASRYGVNRQADWPLAPIRLAALGIVPGDAYWLASDPVTLAVGRDDIQLTGMIDDLGRADADALLETLNAHFAADGLTFVAPRPDAFFVRVAHTPRLTTHPPCAASGRSLRTLLPDGPDADTWRRWQSEIQMLLHDHPVNAERERAGRAPANSLWFSYGGTLPRRRELEPSIHTFATAGIAVALAAYAGSPARAIPNCLDDALNAAGTAEMIVVALEPSLDWETVERSWCARARHALHAGRVAAVSLFADDMGDAVVWRARRPGLWQRFAGRYARHDLVALLAAVGINGGPPPPQGGA